ncbi:hypothetical protein KFE98_08280 [bacterium SCSIO 12741]|nr:hypothetical protein KFE98_08280 [bacterium SCSIO 12741]
MKWENFVVVIFLLLASRLEAQQVPNVIENIDYLVTFCPEASKSYGDDDFTQVFFFAIPESHTRPFYIRVYDPEVGGEIDAKHGGAYDSKFRYTVFGGKGCFSDEANQSVEPNNDLRKGVMLATKTFTNEARYENGWYTFGPFNPKEGEYSPEQKARIFKIIAEGLSGDDGNLYRYFISQNVGANKAILGANAFTYEYSFRMKSEPSSVAHLYPFLSRDVVSIKQHNFDFDSDGQILIYSVAKNRHVSATSGNGDWAEQTHEIVDREKNASLDMQFVKAGNAANDMVVYITNQYDKPVPFFAIPIGGKPAYDYNLQVKVK